MSSGEKEDVRASLWSVWISIGKMIMDDVRDAVDVLRFTQLVVTNPNFISVLDAPRAASVSTEPEGGWAAEWQRFYHEVFDLEVDFTGLPLPAEQPGFGWVVMVAPGVSHNQAWAACKRRFGKGRTYSSAGDDLDRAVLTNDRSPAAAYAKRLRNRVSADEEMKNLSANALQGQEVTGITLLERILLELWYEWKTGGGHLDLVTVTLCAGSRDRYGDVARTNWIGNQFHVNFCHPDSALDELRARVAV
ncbi:MAG: hypothetical protein Q7S66_04865 [bacterium]|nr:hypothetical protein [bacterium]